jgi:tetratricopeptide (TPR) repeat protein
VLVLDDLHWAAQPTLLLLRHLLRGDEATPLLVLATYRDTDLGRSHPLAGFLADLRRAANAERIDLRGLPADEVQEFIRAAAGQPLDADLAALAQNVWTETEGNPFFVGQVLRHLVETRAVIQDDEGRWIPGPNAGHVGLPEGVREVIGRRLSRLSDDTNALLATAAVIGREFDTALLVEASDADTEAVFDALEQAEEARLLVPVAGRPGRYGFAHALVRSTLYDELATTRRLRLHRRVGTALEARGDTGQVDELARHWSEAAALGETDRAVNYCGRAAEQAQERLAYEEAAGWYERALAVLDPDHSDHATRAKLLIGLGNAQWFAGALVASRETFDQAIGAARQSGDPDLFAVAAVGRGGRRAWTDAGLVDDALMAALEEALERLPTEDSVLRARVTGRLASELYFAFGGLAPQRRAELSEAALAMARRIGDPECLGYALSTFHWGAWLPGNARDRLAVADELLEVAVQAGNLELETIAWQQRMIDQWELGDIDGLRQSAERERQLFGAMRIAEGDWIMTVFDCTLALFEGRIDDAERLMHEALAHAERMESPTALQFYGVQQLAIRRMRGGMADMVPLCQAMVDEYPAIPAWRTGLAYALVESGDRDRAAEQLRILATHEFRDLPADANWHVGVSLCALVAEVVGDEASGALLYDLLEPHSEFWVCAGMPADCVGPGSGYTGRAAGAPGRLDDAERLLNHAVDQCETAGSRPLRVGAATDLARVLRRRGDDERARALVEACLAICDELGMPALRDKAEQVLAD